MEMKVAGVFFWARAGAGGPTAMPKFMRSLVMWLGMLLAVTTPASSQTYFVQQPGIDFKTTAWHTQPLADDAPIDPNSAILVQTLVMALHASQTTVYSFSDMPVYIVPANQPTVRVVTACDPGPPCDLLQQQFNAVPMPYPYDFLIVATGARHSYFGHDNWAPAAPGLKRIEDALDIRRRLLFAFERALREGKRLPPENQIGRRTVMSARARV
jgi:hypothetical protein